MLRFKLIYMIEVKILKSKRFLLSKQKYTTIFINDYLIFNKLILVSKN